MVKSSTKKRKKSPNCDAWTEDSSCPLPPKFDTKRCRKISAIEREQRREREKIRREKIKKKPENEQLAHRKNEKERHKKYRAEKKKLADQVQKNTANLSDDVSAL